MFGYTELLGDRIGGMGCFMSYFLELCCTKVLQPRLFSQCKHKPALSLLRRDPAQRHGQQPHSGRKAITTFDHIANSHVPPHELAQAGHVVIFAQRGIGIHQTIPYHSAVKAVMRQARSV